MFQMFQLFQASDFVSIQWNDRNVCNPWNHLSKSSPEKVLAFSPKNFCFCVAEISVRSLIFVIELKMVVHALEHSRMPSLEYLFQLGDERGFDLEDLPNILFELRAVEGIDVEVCFLCFR